MLVDLYGLFVRNVVEESRKIISYQSQSNLGFIQELNRFLERFPNKLVFDLVSRISTFYKRLFQNGKNILKNDNSRKFISSSLEFILYNELIEHVQAWLELFIGLSRVGRTDPFSKISVGSTDWIRTSGPRN